LQRPRGCDFPHDPRFLLREVRVVVAEPHFCRRSSLESGDGFSTALLHPFGLPTGITRPIGGRGPTASVRIISEIYGQNPESYLNAAAATKLAAREKRWLISLFRDPIVLGDTRGVSVNGQHRGCALRFSGAARAAVVVDSEIVVDEYAYWTYLGDG